MERDRCQRPPPRSWGVPLSRARIWLQGCISGCLAAPSSGCSRGGRLLGAGAPRRPLPRDTRASWSCRALLPGGALLLPLTEPAALASVPPVLALISRRQNRKGLLACLLFVLSLLASSTLALAFGSSDHTETAHAPDTAPNSRNKILIEKKALAKHEMTDLSPFLQTTIPSDTRRRVGLSRCMARPP